MLTQINLNCFIFFLILLFNVAFDCFKIQFYNFFFIYKYFIFAHVIIIIFLKKFNPFTDVVIFYYIIKYKPSFIFFYYIIK